MGHKRSDRLHDMVKDDQRNQFARDRDRILYCSAFRRLAGVTQIVSPAEGSIFHNRLTHTLKVAQVARRIAEMLINQYGQEWAERVGLHPEVVDAAALGHDLGHPPFGHNGEETLDDLINQRVRGISDGFEGNAQTFRVVTVLAKRSERWNGLNLTKATLNALLKYPWHKQTDGPKSKKFGAYQSEDMEFKFAREGMIDESQSVEAAVMDIADDIAYSVHDVEDFYRANLLPLHRILREDEEEIELFLTSVLPELKENTITIHDAKKILESLTLTTSPELNKPYDGSLKQKAALRAFTSLLVSRYVQGISMAGDGKINLDPVCEAEITILKQLPKYYIYEHPNLSAQKFGQRKIIEFIFNALFESFSESNNTIWPKFYHDLLVELGPKDERIKARVVADIIASRTEQEINELYLKLNGIKSGRISDIVVS